MTTVCEICGKTSSNDKVCSNCGAEILSNEKRASLPSHLEWGWATFNLESLPADLLSQAVDQLKHYWVPIEKFSVLSLAASQLESFNILEHNITVLVREDDYLQLSSKIRYEFDKIVTSFECIGYLKFAAQINEILNSKGLLCN